MENISVFIFAHQDDEFGIYAELVRLINKRTKVIIIYLTSGSLDGKKRPDRESESLTVLKNIGVKQENIHFLGTDLNIPAARMFEYLDIIYPRLLSLLSTQNRIKSLYFLSWEGGHQDHDATHIIGLALAKQLNILDHTFQFTLYSGYKLPWVLFKLFSPLIDNGEVITYRISWDLRWRFIKYILSYKSQFIPLAGLFPFFLFHLIFKGKQILQPVNINRLLEKPHTGRLLYERRSKIEYNKFNNKVQGFINSNIINTN
jgi:LmbE family N-acetylglucosaminyl deacetylase